MSNCGPSGCLLSDERDPTLDMIIYIIVASILLVAVFLCIIFSAGCKTAMVEPASNLRNSYMRATIVFSKLFQRPAKPVPPPSMHHSWKQPPARQIDATAARSRRSLGETSVGMDLTTETKIFYSGTMLTNNIVATGSHLEYCFDESTVETTTMYPPNSTELMKLKIAYLPTIRESKSSESISNLTTDSTRWLRPRVRREIVLFTGPEEKREWLSDGDSSEEDFLWAFEEADSDEEREPHERKSKRRDNFVRPAALTSS